MLSLSLCFCFGVQELVRLLQQTLRGSQYDKRSSSIQPGGAPDGMELVREKDQQIQALSAHIEKLGLEKESLHQEVKSLKNKVGELNEQLGMLMETIQAKDEVIIKNSSSHTEEASIPSKDLQELGRLKVGGNTVSLL